MNHYTLMHVLNASTFEDVEASTPEEAAKKAKNAYAFVCHHCAKDVEIGEVYRTVVLDAEGDEVWCDEKDPADELRELRATLTAERAAAVALVEALPECQCCESKASRTFKVDDELTEFCEHHFPDDWYACGEYSGPWPIGYDPELRALLKRHEEGGW